MDGSPAVLSAGDSHDVILVDCGDFCRESFVISPDSALTKDANRFLMIDIIPEEARAMNQNFVVFARGSAPIAMGLPEIRDDLRALSAV